jgi:hypothetical protein
MLSPILKLVFIQIFKTWSHTKTKKTIKNAVNALNFVDFNFIFFMVKKKGSAYCKVQEQKSSSFLTQKYIFYNSFAIRGSLDFILWPKKS